jgi:hypothetical protein
MNFQRTDLPLLTGLVKRSLRLRAKSGKLALAALLSIMCWSNTFTLLAHAQDTPAASPRTPEQEATINQLKFEKEAAELRKAIRDAQFNPTVTVPEGKIGLTNVFIETEILSYNAMSEDALTNVIKEKKEKVAALQAADKEIKKNKGTIAKNAQEIAKLKAKLPGSRGRARQKIIEQIAALEKANAELKKATDELEAKHGEGIRQLPALEAAIRKAEETIAQNSSRILLLKSLNQQFDKLIGDYAKLDVSTGVNGLTVFVKAQGLEEVLKGEPSFLLQIKPVKAGGNNRTRRNLVRYLSGAKVDHSGGFIVEYMLYDKTGAVVYSDKYAFYDGYKDPKKIREIKEN